MPKLFRRDLKPENIMLSSLDSDIDFKVIDFGLCDFSLAGDSCRKPCGTFAYMAPEVASVYDYRVDIWNIGIIMYYILSGKRPFRSYDMKKLEDQNQFESALQDVGRRRLVIDDEDPVWMSISDDAKSLLHGLMHHVVDERITLRQALQHPWFRNGS